ncbi:MAG: hypothetical protein O2854_09550 [Chloroflexi bacterium]|nr:hypothetical protein [Chloroflexota bacterium]
MVTTETFVYRIRSVQPKMAPYSEVVFKAEYPTFEDAHDACLRRNERWADPAHEDMQVCWPVKYRRTTGGGNGDTARFQSGEVEDFMHVVGFDDAPYRAALAAQAVAAAKRHAARSKTPATAEKRRKSPRGAK